MLFLISGGQSLASELVKVTRVDSKDIVQLYFSFDKTPLFSQTTNGKRINLIFSQTKPVEGMDLFEADDKIVKILSQTVDGDFLLSLFFRYTPQHFKFSKSTDDKIVFEVLLGNQYSKSYKNLADRLKGLTVLDRDSANFSNPYVLSPYVKDWMSFFSQYESPVTVDIPVQFTNPPFPIIRILPPGKENNLRILSPDMFKLADQGLWGHLADLVLEKLQSEPDIKTQKMLALTYGEVLARNNDFEGAFKQLYLLNEKYQEEHIGNFSEFLLILLRGIHENPHIADFEFRDLEKKISTTNPLSPYLLLAQTEAALATSQYSRMNKLLLRDDIAFPDHLEKIREIRQADYWFAIRQPIKAFVAYGLLSQSELLFSQPYSLNGYCTTLYNQKQFRESAECYEQLSSLSINKESLGMIQYRENMAKLKFQSGADLIDTFSQIENIFSGSEAGYRAALKKIDLYLLQDRSRFEWAKNKYALIAKESVLRATTVEALFKQALIHSMLNQNAQSIVLLQKLLREFRHGDIRSSAQALLIELLPQEIKRLVDEKEYIKALVLAKQNKELFLKNWIDSRYLIDIAQAFYKIGIYNEAQRLYLYLIEIVPVDQKEQFFLPMIKASFDQGNYSLVEDYAAQYTYNYPEGKFSNEILFLRLQALVADERLEDALQLLPSPLPENEGALYNLAASLFYRTDNYERCANLFKLLQESGSQLNQEEQIMYGESLFKTEHFKEAEDVFVQIKKENPFFDQSLYRLAELERKNGREKNALRFFKKIVETGTNDRWKRYAKKELQFADATARM